MDVRARLCVHAETIRSNQGTRDACVFCTNSGHSEFWSKFNFKLVMCNNADQSVDRYKACTLINQTECSPLLAAYVPQWYLLSGSGLSSTGGQMVASV